jgi:hypothetical protein
MDDAIETWERNGLTVRLYQDDQAFSPADWDNLGTLYLDTGRDQYDFAHPIEGGHSVAAWIRAHQIAGHDLIMLTFHDYGSGGLSMRETHDLTDADGFLVALPESIALLGVDEDDIPRQLRGEMEEWQQYLAGDVYGYTLTTPEGNVLDSLWGLYGYDYAREEANGAADGYTAAGIIEADRASLTTARDEITARLAALDTEQEA